MRTPNIPIIDVNTGQIIKHMERHKENKEEIMRVLEQYIRYVQNVSKTRKDEASKSGYGKLYDNPNVRYSDVKRKLQELGESKLGEAIKTWNKTTQALSVIYYYPYLSPKLKKMIEDGEQYYRYRIQDRFQDWWKWSRW